MLQPTHNDSLEYITLIPWTMAEALKIKLQQLSYHVGSHNSNSIVLDIYLMIFSPTKKKGTFERIFNAVLDAPAQYMSFL
jgi:hypothetical protein